MANRMTEQFDDCRLIFKNFKGDEGPYNKKGERTFAVAIPEESEAQRLLALGWNIKWPKPKPDIDPKEDTRTPRLPVEARYDPIPPNIWVVTSKARTRLTDDTVEMLDYADINRIDLIVNGSRWTVNENSGIKAYVKTMFVFLNEDALELRYAVGNEQNQSMGGEE